MPRQAAQDASLHAVVGTPDSETGSRLPQENNMHGTVLKAQTRNQHSTHLVYLYAPSLTASQQCWPPAWPATRHVLKMGGNMLWVQSQGLGGQRCGGFPKLAVAKKLQGCDGATPFQLQH